MRPESQDLTIHLEEVEKSAALPCPIGKTDTHKRQSRFAKSFKKRHQSGQIVFEYVLLLVISVGAATLLTRMLVSRNAENGGVVTGAWANTINAIGSDVID